LRACSATNAASARGQPPEGAAARRPRRWRSMAADERLAGPARCGVRRVAVGTLVLAARPHALPHQVARAQRRRPGRTTVWGRRRMAPAGAHGGRAIAGLGGQAGGSIDRTSLSVSGVRGEEDVATEVDREIVADQTQNRGLRHHQVLLFLERDSRPRPSGRRWSWSPTRAAIRGRGPRARPPSRAPRLAS